MKREKDEGQSQCHACFGLDSVTRKTTRYDRDYGQNEEIVDTEFQTG